MKSALKAAKNNTGLVLSGKCGTGKTHLAVAIALYAMKHRHQAIFRLVNELLNEIRLAVAENADYYGVIQRFKEVPCLVLDDLGKERTTDFGLDALYDIVDYRYRNEFQTIITTQAKTLEELASWGNFEYTTPMVSRVMERGANGKLFGIMTEMYAVNKPVDMLTLCEELKAKDLYEPIGGQVFLSEVMTSIITTATIQTHAEIVRD